LSTPSQLYFGKGFFLCFATQILHPSGHSVAKKAGTAWEHWTSQIDDHLKPSTVAKRCTSLKSRKSPALRGFVAGRWALATTFLYPSTKIERPQRAKDRTPWRRSSSEFECPGLPGFLHRGCPRRSPSYIRPNSRRNPRFRTSASNPPQNRPTGLTRPRRWPSCGCSVLLPEWV